MNLFELFTFCLLIQLEIFEFILFHKISSLWGLLARNLMFNLDRSKIPSLDSFLSRLISFELVVWSLSVWNLWHKLAITIFRILLRCSRHVQIAALFENNFDFVVIDDLDAVTDLAQVILVGLQYFSRSHPRQNNKDWILTQVLCNVDPHCPGPFHLNHYFTLCVGWVVDPVFVLVELGLHWRWGYQKVSQIGELISFFQQALSHFSLAVLIEKMGLRKSQTRILNPFLLLSGHQWRSWTSIVVLHWNVIPLALAQVNTRQTTGNSTFATSKPFFVFRLGLSNDLFIIILVKFSTSPVEKFLLRWKPNCLFSSPCV
jgi:hypothetical protein